MAEKTPTLESLGAKVAELSRELSTLLKAGNYPQPSFAADGPMALPPDPKINLPRLQLIELLLDMLHLAHGPKEYIMEMSFAMSHDPWTFEALEQFDFFGAVPLDGSASYDDIAQHTKLPAAIVRRILRYAMQNHVFAETQPGSERVVHTATSATCQREPALRSLLGHCMEEVRPAAGEAVPALKKWFAGTAKATEEMEHCGWPLAQVGGKPTDGEPLWSYLKNSEAPGREKGWRARRFADAMLGISKAFAVGYDAPLETYDWEALGDATVIDLGGSAGHVSQLVAEKHAKLKFIIQDLPEVEPAFKANIPASLAPRMSFQAYDFFTPEQVTADVFLIKSVLHDWPDKHAAQILGNLVPVLRPGKDHVLIFDIILPPALDESGNPVLPRSMRKFMYSIDLQMHAMVNAKERQLEDWIALMKRADERFELQKVCVVPGQPLGIMDFVLKA